VSSITGESGLNLTASMLRQSRTSFFTGADILLIPKSERLMVVVALTVTFCTSPGRLSPSTSSTANSTGRVTPRSVRSPYITAVFGIEEPFSLDEFVDDRTFGMQAVRAHHHEGLTVTLGYRLPGKTATKLVELPVNRREDASNAKSDLRRGGLDPIQIAILGGFQHSRHNLGVHPVVSERFADLFGDSALCGDAAKEKRQNGTFHLVIYVRHMPFSA